MEEVLLNSIKKALNELIISFFNKEITDDDVLKALNESIHYNKKYSPYIYEMFYIQALELNKVPKNKYFLLELFKITCNEDCLIMEEFDTEGTRVKVLKKLNLLKTLECYENFLIFTNDEAHTFFKEGVKNLRYIKAKNTKPSMMNVLDCLKEELDKDQM